MFLKDLDPGRQGALTLAGLHPYGGPSPRTLPREEGAGTSSALAGALPILRGLGAAWPNAGIPHRAPTEETRSPSRLFAPRGFGEALTPALSPRERAPDRPRWVR